MAEEMDFARGEPTTEDGTPVSAFDAPDITPEQYAEHWANTFARALEATKLFSIFEVRAGVDQFHVMGRVHKANERVWFEKIIDKIVKFEHYYRDGNGFIGKQYVFKEDKNDTRFGWIFSFSSPNLKEMVFALCRSFEESIPRAVVTEAPLLGPSAPQSGGQKTGRRGAAPVSAGKR
jgi:hypothetical protein